MKIESASKIMKSLNESYNRHTQLDVATVISKKF